jgi:hypothetical protein
VCIPAGKPHAPSPTPQRREECGAAG